MARRRWELWAALGAAFLAFELVVDLSVSLVILCSMFGWNDLLTAWWVWRRDPNRPRGGLAAALYATSALLKIGAGAFGVFILIATIVSKAASRDRSPIGPPQGAAPAYEMATVGVAVGSLMAAWGLANLTCGVALWERRKLWLGPEAGLARGQGVWPPWAADWSRLNRPGPTNRIRLILWLAVIPWSSVMVGVASWLATSIFGDGKGTLIAVAFASLGSIVLIMGVVLPRLGPRVVAASPFEAWELEAP